MTKKSRAARRRGKISVIALGLTMALFVAGCGDAKKSSGNSPAAGSGIVPKDIPSIDQLRKGTESAPPTTGPAAVPGKNVYWISCGESTPGCSAVAAAGADAAKKAGWNFRIIDGKLSYAGIMAGIRQAIAANADAIITHGVDCPLILQALRDAKTAGVPVVGMAGSDCNEVPGTKAGGEDLLLDYVINDKTRTNSDFWVGYGQLVAQYLIRASDGKADVLNMNSSSLGGLNKVIFDSFTKEMEKCSTCKVTNTSVTAGDYANEGMGKKLNTALLQHPDADWVTMNIDGQMNLGGALRVVDQARSSGRKLKVIGGEGTEFGMQALRDGRVEAETAYDVERNGWMAIDILNRYFANKPQVPEGWGVRLVDKEAASGQPASGAYKSTFDFKAAYTKIWQGK